MTQNSRPLGHDIDGQPLYVGDRVKLVGPEVREPFRGQVCHVVATNDTTRKANILLPGWGPFVSLDDGMFARGVSLRRLDRRAHASWDEVRAVSGWSPRTAPNLEGERDDDADYS